MLILRITLLLLLVATHSFSAELAKKDFAFGRTIEVDGNGAVYSLPLPHDVYAASVWDNLADVRVFNSDGQVVPHEFRHTALQVNALLARKRIPYFPLAGVKDPAGEDVSLEVRRNIGGDIVNIERKGDVQLPARAYLLDLAGAGPYPVTLRLQWKTDGAGILVPVEIGSSEDLLRWRSLKSTTLADLEFMGNRIVHRDIVLEDKPSRYVRLRLGQGATAMQVTGVEAISRRGQQMESRNWVEVLLAGERKGGGDALGAMLDATVPVDRIQVVFPQPNSMLKARIETRSSLEPLRYRATSLFYELLENGVRLSNEPVQLPRENVRYIKLDVIQDGAGAANGGIKLRAGYIPHDLVFIARGKGPFLLAYGNGRLKSGGPGENSADIHGLAGEGRVSVVRNVVLGKQMVLGGRERLAKKKESPWKQLVLWGVLLGGAALLGFMAWSLLRGGKGR